MATSRYSLNTSATRFTYWTGGSTNKGMLGQSHTYWNPTAARQLAYSDYTYNYYTTYMKFNNDQSGVSISSMNATHYPTAIKIKCKRASGLGSYGSQRTARFGCVTSANANNTSGLAAYSDVTIEGSGVGITEYTITTDQSKAQTFVNTLAGGGWFVLGCNSKPTSNTSPMNITNYMGIEYSNMELVIEWTTRATACSAPTAVTISPTVGTPNQSVTISWSGAKAGTNNPISGFRIFWRDGAQPTTSTYTGYKDVTSSSTSGSTTVSVSGTRGTTRYFKVQTKGAYGTGYWSAISSASDSILTNSLPTITNVSPATGTVFVSSTTSFRFTSFTGAANGGYSSLSYAYSTSVGGPKISCTTSTLIPLSTGSNTFYIYAYDGYEYSSNYITRTYIKNVAPTVTFGTITTPSISTQGTPDAGYTYATRLSATATSNKTGTYYFQYLIGTTWRDLTNNTTGKLSNVVLPNLTGVAANTKIKQLRVRIYDGYEYSNYNTANINIHIIPDPVTLGNVYNQLGSSNVANTNPSHFYQNVRVYFRGDEGITAVRYSINSGTEISSTSFFRGNSSSQGYVNLNLASIATKKGASYIIKIMLYRDNLKATLPTLTMFRTNIPTFTNVPSVNTSLGTGGLRPHVLKDSTEIFTVSFYNIFQSSTPDFVNDFDMSNTLTNNLEVKIMYGGNYVTVPYISSSLSSDTITLYYKKNLITDAIANSLGITTYYGTYPIGVQLNLKNSFNERSTKTFTNVFTLYFTEDFPMDNSDLVTELNDVSMTNGILIRHGDRIDFNVAFKSYNYVKTTFQPQIARINTIGMPLETDWKNYGAAIEETPSGTPSIGVPWAETKVYSVAVEEISESKYVYLRMKITNTVGKEIKCTSPVYSRFIRHSAASGLLISDLKFTRNSDREFGDISITYSSNNSGMYLIDNYELPGLICTATLEFSLTSNFAVIETSIDTPWKNLTTYSDIQAAFTGAANVTENISSRVPNTGWNFYYARIKLVTEDTNEIYSPDRTRTTYSAPFLIYNISPTVSYRSNQVGINYDLQPGSNYSDGVMVISESTGKNKIYLISAGDTPVLDSYIELKNGHIIFNGGTWD